MRGVSAESLNTVLDNTATLIANEHDLEPIARQLFEAARIIDSSNQLVRVLSDSGRGVELKTELVDRLFNTKAHSAVVEILRTVVSKRWSEQNHILDAIELAGVRVLLEVAARNDAAEAPAEELFQFARLIESTPELAQAFDSKRDDASARVDLAAALLNGRAHRSTVLIAQQAVSFGYESKTVRRLDAFAEFASAIRKRKSGVVVSAIELTPAQQERLTSTLAKRYGSDLSLNYEVDPQVVGGMLITVGDDLYDASIFGRMREAQEVLTA